MFARTYRTTRQALGRTCYDIQYFLFKSNTELCCMSINVTCIQNGRSRVVIFREFFTFHVFLAHHDTLVAPVTNVLNKYAAERTVLDIVHSRSRIITADRQDTFTKVIFLNEGTQTLCTLTICTNHDIDFWISLL